MLFTPRKEPEKRKDKEKLMQYALYLLGQRDYFEAKLLDKLRSYAEKYSDADDVLAKMLELNYVNDARTLEIRIRNAAEYPSKGPTRIRRELMDKGAPSSLIDAGLREVDREIWHENCKELYRNKYRNDWETLKERDKRMRYLVNRGFGFDDAKAAVSQTLNEECNDEY